MARLMSSSGFFTDAPALSSQQALPPHQGLQPPGNLVNRTEFEKKLQPLILRQGVGVISYHGLASGFSDRQIPH